MVFPCYGTGANTLITYPSPGNNHTFCKSVLYKVIISQGNVHKESFVYASSKTPEKPSWEWGKQAEKQFHFTSFSLTGPAIVDVVKYNCSAQSATIRSNFGSNRIVETSGGVEKKISFSLIGPSKISVEFDDDKKNNNILMIFADSLEDISSKPVEGTRKLLKVKSGDNFLSLKRELANSSKSVVYFPPGVYDIGYWDVPKSVSHIYISGGAFINGYIHASRDNNTPLIINGRGVISSYRYPFHYPDTGDIRDSKFGGSRKWYKTIEINGGRNHVIEGLTLIDGSAFYILLNANNSVVKNVKINGFRYNNDGITISGFNITVDDCFLRVNDDAVVLKGKGSYKVKRCIFWQLKGGSCIQLGWYPQTISGKNVIEDCDVLHAEWDDPRSANIGFLNAMNFSNATPHSVVENFVIQNIYIQTEVLRIIDIRMNRNGNKQPNSFRNFFFRNIYAKIPVKSNDKAIYLNGFDQARCINNFIFLDFYINGIKLVNRTSKFPFFFDAGEFIYNVRFE